MMRTCVNYKGVNKTILIKNKIKKLYWYSTLANVQINSHAIRGTDEEWLRAKPFKELPGPPKFLLLPVFFLPGDNIFERNMLNLHKHLRRAYGSISVLKGIFGRPNIVFTYNPEDFEKVFRTEGLWPKRVAFEAFQYYRTHIKPEKFKGIGSLVTEQNKTWHDIRTKVNPILLKTQTVKHSLQEIDEIATEFLNKIPDLRNPKTMEMPENFYDEIRKWSIESICSVALNRRLGLIKSKNPDSNALHLSEKMETFFQLSFEYDVVPSFWKYYETKKFKKLIAIFDEVIDITTNYIDEAFTDFKKRSHDGAKTVLEKLLELEKQIAFVVAIDMLMAGIDTTSVAFTTVLYNIAKNPVKQNILREEIKAIFPDKDTKCTETNTKNLPYLRACIKEALRITPIVPGNYRTTAQDLVLSGYQIPKGTGILMGNMALSNEAKYFSKSHKFIPERWLKGQKGIVASKSSNPFVCLPFGFGPRTCIGKKIAAMEIETLVIKLIRNYEVTWDQPDLEYTCDVLIKPKSSLKFKFIEF